MTLRLIQVILPVEKRSEILDILQDAKTPEIWSTDIGEGRIMVSLLLQSEGTEAVMDKLESSFSDLEGYSAMIIEVLAFTPHPEKNEKGKQAGEEDEVEENGRVSREELYTTLIDYSKSSKSYIALMLLSVVVAAVGIFENNVAIIIGAAVINPLLGPNIALSFATNLADAKLAKASLKTLALGIAIILFISIIVGLALDINPFIPEIASRRDVSLGEIVLAVASGSAAALLITLRASISLVGVGVAVALLPPLVTFGLLFGAGQADLSIGSLLLFITDFICINLAGVFTFYIMGIRPFKWWEADRARRSTVIAIIVWGILLAILAAIVLFA